MGATFSKPAKLTGSESVTCECGNHLDRCKFGRPHIMASPWYAGGGVWRLTSKCFDCGSECLCVE